MATMRASVGGSGLFLATLCGLPAGVLGQVIVSEVEPNNTKSGASVVAGGGGGMVAGDGLSGFTTGAGTSVGGTANWDYFDLRIAPAPLAIYRHRLLLPGTAPYATSLRGLTQTGGAAGTTGVINPGTDATLQNGFVIGQNRVSQWYGFGKGERVYYRVGGSSATTSLYCSTLITDVVTPIDLVGTVFDGSITIESSPGAGDTEINVFDANLNPVPGFQNDDVIGPPSSTSARLARTFTPGTYYIAFSNFGTATDQPVPPDENFRAQSVTDFPGLLVNSASSTNSNANITVTSAAGSAVGTGARTEPFQVVWYRMIVQPNVQPTLPTLTTSFSPRTAFTGRSVLISAAVSPGQNPASTGLVVSADTAQLGGGSIQLLDDGTGGDPTPGDGVYSASVAIPASLPEGIKTVPVTVADAQGRSAAATVTLPAVTPIHLGAIGGTVGGSVASVDNNSPIAGGQIRWYTLTLAQPTSAGNFLDIFTAGTATVPGTDTELALFTAQGGLIASNDDFGGTTSALLSFGQAVPGRSYDGYASTAAGQNNSPAGNLATLPAGVYFLAAGMFNCEFHNDFAAVSTGSSAGTLRISVRTASGVPGTQPQPVRPATILAGAGQTVTLSTQLVPAMNPPSTGAVLNADLTSLGGAAAVAMVDDGTGGDAVANDGVFTCRITLSSSQAAGSFPVNFSVLDAQGRSSSASTEVVITPVIELGQVAAAVSPVVNSSGVLVPGKVLWYSATLPGAGETALVDLHTLGSAFTGAGPLGSDTELGLYLHNGVRVAQNDDFGGRVESLLLFGRADAVRVYEPFVPPPGVTVTSPGLSGGRYYIAVGGFDSVFGLTEFGVTSGSSRSGPVTLNIITDNTPACNVADLVTVGGIQPPDGILTGDDFNAFIAAFAGGELLADVVAVGGVLPPDGILTGDDFNAFINAFAAGCP
ncbi:MAG: GC-type dockerin domain-anchored protein [bacterium]